jgi:hypothetical protein
MKRMTRLIALAAILGLVLFGAGCGSLSLFSSRHVHYHASPDADKKIDLLEKRVEALEKAAQSKQ